MRTNDIDIAKNDDLRTYVNDNLCLPTYTCSVATYLILPNELHLKIDYFFNYHFKGY
jgi:hypothetical protein